jgi:RNA-directed DNA polymerase
MDRVRVRVKDKRVLALVKVFLKAGVLTELGEVRDTLDGKLQGGILSPLIFNVAMSVLDEHLHGPGSRAGRYRPAVGASSGKEQPSELAVIRYCDDFVVLVDGCRSDVEAFEAWQQGWSATRVRFGRP